MARAHQDMLASELAAWLRRREYAKRLWTVDGDYDVMSAAFLPCPGKELAAAFDRWKTRKLRLYAPPGAAANLQRKSLADWAGRHEGSELVFELAWVDKGKAGRRWLLELDTFAEAARDEADEVVPARARA